MFNFDLLNINNISRLRHVFRDNFEIEELSDDIQELINSGFIKISEDFYVKCVNRGDRDFLNLTEDQKICTGISYVNEAQEVSECQACNRQLSLENKEKFKVYTISLNYNTIIKVLREKLGKEKTSIKKDNAHIIFVNNDGNEHTLCILDLCENIDCKTSFYYSDEILYIYCDVVVGFDAPNVIWLFDLLLKKAEELSNFIRTTTPLLNTEKIRKVMKNFIDNLSWQKFEDFITQLLNYIRDNPKNYNEGITFLQKYSGTIISSFSVKLSGSGRTDAYSIDILNYFQQTLKSDIRIECKHSEHSNINSSVGKIALRELMDHAYQNEGVIFTNREKIDGYALNRCIDFREKDGQWRYVIIHRPLLILFISLFLKEFWDNPKKIISSLLGNN